MTSVRPKLRPDALKAISGWDVITGQSMWRTPQGGWSNNIDHAAILSGDKAEEALALAKKEEGKIVEPYFMEICEDGRPCGREALRERIRMNGPSHSTSRAFTAHF